MGCGLSRVAPDPDAPCFKNHERRKQWMEDERKRIAARKARLLEIQQIAEDANKARRRDYDEYQAKKREAAKYLTVPKSQVNFGLGPFFDETRIGVDFMNIFGGNYFGLGLFFDETCIGVDFMNIFGGIYFGPDPFLDETCIGVDFMNIFGRINFGLGPFPDETCIVVDFMNILDFESVLDLAFPSALTHALASGWVVIPG